MANDNERQSHKQNEQEEELALYCSSPLREFLTQEPNLVLDKNLQFNILPKLGRRFYHMFQNAPPGRLADRLRPFLNETTTKRMRAESALLFFDIDFFANKKLTHFQLHDCGLRDHRRQLPLPNQVWTRTAALPASITNPWSFSAFDSSAYPFIVGVENKVVLWTNYNGDSTEPFTYIMTTGPALEWSFRPLETKHLSQQLGDKDNFGHLKLLEYTAVGHRLAVVVEAMHIDTPVGEIDPSGVDVRQYFHMVLDTTTGIWSVLPSCPAKWDKKTTLSFEWNGRLYVWSFFNSVTEVIYFGFEANQWVEDAQETGRFARLPRRFAETGSRDLVPFIVSARDGTLYAVYNLMGDDVQCLKVFSASDDTDTDTNTNTDGCYGWSEVDLRKTPDTRTNNPFQHSKKPDSYPFSVRSWPFIETKMECWPVLDEDSILVVIRRGKGAEDRVYTYSWWMIGKECGIHAYGHLDVPFDQDKDLVHFIAKVES